jgi:uncharacterized protein YprB with RNaseH-like and TPR domain
MLFHDTNQRTHTGEMNTAERISSMNDAENGSDIARLRRRIALEEEAARLGLTGLAIVASHEIITARMERGAERILQLIEEGKHAEAVALMNTETWGIEEQGKPGEQRTFIE